MKVIGIAGPAGSGKSTVARLLSKRRGFAWLNCDELAWTTYRPEGSAYAPLMARFGAGILAEDGTVDRARLAAAAFTDPLRKKNLEGIVHPAVMAAVKQAITEHRTLGTQVLLVEGALLLDSPHVDRSIFDAFVWLSVPEAERRKRLLSSGLEREVVERRLSAQRALAPPKEPCVRVVDGRGSSAEVAGRVLDSLGGR